MSYDKLSLASFQEALKSGKYVNATGARRAVGKATTLSDKDKDKARAAIEAYFGSNPEKAAAPKKVAAKRGPKKKVAAKKITARAAEPVAEAAPRKKPGRKPRAVTASASTPSIPTLDLENTGSIATQIRLAEKTIQNVGAALNVITQAKKECPEADLGTFVEEMGGTLAGAVSIFRSVVHSITKNPSTADTSTLSEVQPPAPPSPPVGIVNNGIVPSRAEGLFRESQPGVE